MALFRCESRWAVFARRMSTTRRSVFISQSDDIFANMALEQWLHANSDLAEHQILMFYRNAPSVALARQQNPWVEVEGVDGVKVARRVNSSRSVYQDKGGLNMTFFSRKEKVDREYNLDVVARAAFREYGVKTVKDEGDLNIRHSKISQSSLEFGDRNGYHQCTLLIDVNKANMRLSLKDKTGPKLINVREENPKVTIGNLLKAIGWEYLRTSPDALQDGGLELARKQRGFHLVNPTDQWFPGLQAIKENLQSWDWCFGETPKFEVSKTFVDDVKVTMSVEKGRICDIKLHTPREFPNSILLGLQNIVPLLKGGQFSEDIFIPLEKFLEDHYTGSYLDLKEKQIGKVVMTA